MKAQMFKIAGVKNEKEFYKLFPDEASFKKKHGKAFQKAKDGIALRKKTKTVGKNKKVIKELPEYEEYQEGGMPGMDMFSGIGDIMGGLDELAAERKQVDISNQSRKTTHLATLAAIGPEDPIENLYNRSEDHIFSGDQLSPVYGTGAGAISQDGAEVNKAAHAKSSEQARLETIRDKHQKGFNQMSNVFGTVAGAGLIGANARGLDKIGQIAGANTKFWPHAQETLEAGVGMATAKGTVDLINYRNANGLNNMGKSKAYSSQPSREDMNRQDGGYIPIAQDNMPKKFGQKIGDFLNQGAVGQLDEFGNPITVTGNTNADKIASLGNKVGGLMGNTRNAGGSIGKGIGSTVGSAIGVPGADVVLGMFGEQIGNGLDTNAAKIALDETANEREVNIASGMANTKAFSNKFRATQDGGNVDGGDIKALWGGGVEASSFNPTIPGGGESLNVYGNAHNGSNTPGESGVGFNINGNRIEAEKGEVISKLQDGGGEKVVIFGNLPVTATTAKMLGDPKAAGKKMKNYAKEINKMELKSNKQIQKFTEKIGELSPITSFDKLKQNSYKASLQGHTAQLKISADKKQNLASLQNSISETAEENGWVANDLARGNIKVDKGMFTPSNQTTAKDGIEIAQEGVDEKKDPKTFTEEEIEGYKKEGWILSDDGKTMTLEGTEATKELVSKGEKGTDASYEQIETQGKVIGGGYKGRMSDADWKKYLKNETAAQKKKRIAREVKDGVREKSIITQGKGVITPSTPPTEDVYKDIPGTPGQTMNRLAPDEEEEKKFGVNDAMGLVNNMLPYIRPSDQSPFDSRQTLGEMYALAHNKLEPVQAQQYRPELDTPYRISLQDQRNDVTAASRAASKLAGYNPAAQAMIASQSYNPLNRSNADEFRINQDLASKTYDKNRATLNQAKLTNIDIIGQQADKQSLAKSNTKRDTQAALNSISDKYAKHRLENRELAIYENMYNYRFGNNGIAQNMNEVAQWNVGRKTNGKSGSLEEQIMREEERLKKMRKQYKEQNQGASVQDGGSIKKSNLVKALKNY